MEISELLFELSHPTRLEILRLITETPMRLTKIADRVGANNPEVSRHLDRLRAAGLVEREPEGTYLVSPLGLYVLSSLPGLDFLARNSDYFRDHDLSLLPDPFVGRLGELNACERAEGTYVGIEKGIEIYGQSEDWFSTLTPEYLPDSVEVVPDVREKLSQGVTFRTIVGPTFRLPPSLEPTPENRFRVVPKLPLGLGVSEKEAMIVFPDLKGRIDLSVAFSSDDERFLRWCEDLVEWLWSRGEGLK